MHLKIQIGKLFEKEAVTLEKNKNFNMIVCTVVIALLLVLSVFLCINKANAKMTQYSFDELEATTKRLAEECSENVHTDNIILGAMAKLISEQSLTDTENIAKIMNFYDTENSYISEVVLLTPDNMFIRQNGEIVDASGKIDFIEELKNVNRVSKRRYNALNPDELVLYNMVPVVKNSKTEAILCGIVPLEYVSENYAASIYGGNSFIILIDADNGEVLLDTWHDTLGNLYEWNDRETLMGHTFKETANNMRNGKNGDMAFISKTVGRTIYMHYEPVGVNNWSLTLGVREDTALAGTRAVSNTLYIMAIIISLILLFYMVFIISELHSSYRMVYRMSITDMVTGLKNRSAYENYIAETKNKKFNTAVCIYTDINGLHEMNNFSGHDAGDKLLVTAAKCLKKYFSDDNLYRIGGDEFVVLLEKIEKEECEMLIKQVIDELEKVDCSISFGLSFRKNETGLERVVREADEEMLKNKKKYYEEISKRNIR